MRRVVLLGTYDGFVFDPRSQRAATALREDYDVTVVAPCTGHPTPVDGITVVDVKPLPVSVPGLLRLFVFWLQFVIVGLRMGPDIVYASDYYMAFPGWLLSFLIRSRLVYDAHELIIPDPSHPMGIRDRFFYCLERWVVRRTALVAAASDERAESMKLHYGLINTPLVLRNIPVADAVETSIVPPQTPGIVLVYQGAMNLGRGIGLFISAMRHLDDRFQLIMIGDGPDMCSLRKLAEEEGVSERVAFAGRVPRTEMLNALRRCHIGLISYPYKGLNNLLCAPNKIYEYPQAGLPVVTTGHLPLRATLREFPVGVWAGDSAFPPTPQEIACAVRHVAENLDKYRAAIPAFLAAHRWDDDGRSLQWAIKQLG